MTVWCHWCRKANHTDAQCFSTRPADWRPKPEDREPVPAIRYVVAQVLNKPYAAPQPPLAWHSLHR